VAQRKTGYSLNRRIVASWLIFRPGPYYFR